MGAGWGYNSAAGNIGTTIDNLGTQAATVLVTNAKPGALVSFSMQHGGGGGPVNSRLDIIYNGVLYMAINTNNGGGSGASSPPGMGGGATCVSGCGSNPRNVFNNYFFRLPAGSISTANLSFSAVQLNGGVVDDVSIDNVVVEMGPAICLSERTIGGSGGAFALGGTNIDYVVNTIAVDATKTQAVGASATFEMDGTTSQTGNQAMRVVGSSATVTQTSIPAAYAFQQAVCTGGGGTATANPSGNGSFSITGLTGMANCTITNAALPIVRVKKTTTNGSGTTAFGFTLNGASPGSENISFTSPSTSPASPAPHTATAGSITAVTITESSVPTGWPANPTGVSCIDANGASTGNGGGNLGTLSGNAATVPVTAMRGGADITCTFTNSLVPDLSIVKSQRLGTTGTFIGPGTGLKAPVSGTVQYQLVIANATGRPTASNITYSDAVPSNFGSPTVVSTSPSAGVTCPAPTFSGNTLNGGGLTLPANGTCTIVYSVTANTLTSPSAGVVNTATVTTTPTGGTDTNTADNTSSVTTFINPIIRLNDSVVGTPPPGDSALFNLSIGGANATTAFPGGGTNPQNNQGNGGTTGWVMIDATDSGIAWSTVTVAETAGNTTTLAYYKPNLTCFDGNGASFPPSGWTYPGGPIAGGTYSNVVAAPQNPAVGAAAMITCTYTNTVKTATLQTTKSWGTGSLASDTANIAATTGGTPGNAPAFSRAGGTAGTSGAPVTVNVNSSLIFPAETFAPAGSAAKYTTVLVCTADGGATANFLNGTNVPANGQNSNTLVIGAADDGKAIVCSYTNTLKPASIILQKTWRNGTDNNGTTSTTTIPALSTGMVTATGVVNSTSGATPPSNNSTSSTPGAAAVGATLTLPVETLGAGAARFGIGAAAPVYSCTDGTTTVNNIAQGGTVTVPASSANGTLTCTLTNAALPVVVLAKAARPGSQSPTFNFTVSGATNGSAALAFTPNNSVVTQYAAQEHRGTVGTAVTITEATTANWPSAPASAVCTDLNAANSGNPATIPIVSNTATATYTVPAANMVLGANIQCVFSNEQPQVTLNKTFVGVARDSGNFTLRISGVNSQPGNADVTAPATYASGGGGTPFVVVNAGQTVTLSETAGSGTSLSNYTPTISCRDGNNLAYATTVGVPGSWTLTAPSGFISGNSEFIRCDITNTAPTTLQLNKTWAANSTAGDQITVTTTGGSANPTVSSTATAATTPTTTTGLPATVAVGNTINLPAETFTPSTSAANYTTSLACTGGTLSGTDGQVNNTLVIRAADNGQPIVCTYTNTLKPLNFFRLRLRKVFAGNITPNDAITATTTGGTFSGSPSNPTLTADALGGSTPTTGASVFVTQGNTIRLLAENFTTGSQANYTTTVSCNNTASPVTNATPPVNFTVSSVEPSITCTYTNTPVAAPPAILNTTKVLQGINGVAATPGASVKAGDILDYQISVTNTGGSSGTTTLTDNVPANTVFSSAAPSLGWSCANGAASGTACTQTVTVAAGATTLLGYRITVFNPLPVGTASIANSVTTSTGICSSCSVSNPTVAVLDTSKALVKVNGAVTTGTATVAGGDVFLYNIVVRNTGGSSSTTVLSETVPDHTNYTGSGEGWSCATGSAAGIVCTLSVTTAPGSVTTPFTVTVVNPLPVGTTTIVNTVTTSVGTCSACTVTTPGTNLDVSGRVFTDNGAGGGTANDGLINGAEVGVARVGIKLTNCAATIYGTTITDGTGGFKIGVNSSLPVGNPLCVEETNPATRVSTGASYGSTALPSGTAVTASGTSYTYTRTGTPDRIAFAWNGTGHAGLNFGDVDPNTFVADGTKGGQPGNTVSYSHTFTAQTGGSVSFTIASAVAAPTLAGWNEKVFADVGCTGTLQAGAAVLYPPAAPMTVVAGQQVCIVMQEFIPATAQNGYVNTVKLEADFNFTNAAPTLSASYQVTDVTTVGSNALDLKKEVRNVTQGGVFGVNNQAKSGETLEYRISYTNNAAAPISTLAINDTTPAYSTFVSALLESTPVTLTACAKNTPANPLPAATVACPTAQAVGGTGPLDWKFTGSLAPGGTGAVLFQVKVN